jgi:hypothetical protein
LRVLPSHRRANCNSHGHAHVGANTITNSSTVICAIVGADRDSHRRPHNNATHSVTHGHTHCNAYLWCSHVVTHGHALRDTHNGGAHIVAHSYAHGPTNYTRANRHTNGSPDSKSKCSPNAINNKPNSASNRTPNIGAVLATNDTANVDANVPLSALPKHHQWLLRRSRHKLLVHEDE